jgi:ABC-type spermidine/putrescine transport system permease subunit I
MNAAGQQRIARVAIAALLLAPAMTIIAAGFVAPLIRLAVLSFSAPAGPLAAYRELVTVDVYRVVFRNTVVLALVVSVATLVVGFALALALTRLEAGWRAAVFACVVLPLWISVLVRTFSWMLILETNGPSIDFSWRSAWYSGRSGSCSPFPASRSPWRMWCCPTPFCRSMPRSRASTPLCCSQAMVSEPRD